MIKTVRGFAAAMLVTLGVAFASAPASADTFSYDSYSLPNAQTVKITSPAVVGVSPATISAGHFLFKNSKIGGIATNPLDTTAWCIDLAHWFGSAGVVVSPSLAQPVLDQIEALLVGAARQNLNWALNNNSAAMQIAIWKTVYSTFALDAAYGNDVAILARANQLIGYVQDAGNLIYKTSVNAAIGVLDSTSNGGNNQDLATLFISGPLDQVTTPEPASLALISVGLIGLGAARRKFRRA